MSVQCNVTKAPYATFLGSVQCAVIIIIIIIMIITIIIIIIIIIIKIITIIIIIIQKKISWQLLQCHIYTRTLQGHFHNDDDGQEYSKLDKSS